MCQGRCEGAVGRGHKVPAEMVAGQQGAREPEVLEVGPLPRELLATQVEPGEEAL